MSKRLSFSIAVNLLTENFKKGADTVKNSLKSIQMQIITFAAALGMGGLGLSGLLTRFRDVARETSRVITALKNVSGGTVGFADNLKFINELANKYGLEVNALTGNFAKFTSSATQANMPMEQQKKVFESLSRASTAFGLSADDTNGVFLALSQMMGKGKVSMEELRNQMGEKLPVAMQAMAKAMGVSVSQMDKLISTGKVMSADVLPKFADALNEMIPDVDTNNLEASLNRLSNTFGEIVNASGFQEKYKKTIDGLTELIKSASQNIQNITLGVIAVIVFAFSNGATKIWRGWWSMADNMTNATRGLNIALTKAEAQRIAAEKALETSRLRHSVAIGNARIRLAQEVAMKEKLYAQSVLAEDRARLVFTQASAQATSSTWTRSLNAIRVGAAKMWLSLKSMWNTFAPAIVITAIITLAGYLKNVYDESKRIKNIFSEYKKEAEKVSHTAEITQLEKLRSIAYDINKPLKERQTALDVLNGILKSNYTIDSKSLTIQGDINEKLEKRIGLLKAQAKVQYYTSKIAEQEDLKNTLKNRNPKDKDFFEEILSGVFGSAPIKIKNTVNKQNEIDQINKVIEDANKQLEQAIADGGMTNTTTTGGGTPEPDAKAISAAEKARKAAQKAVDDQLKLNNDKAKAALDARNQELENQQALLNLQEDGFDKEQKQIELNHQKELLSIAKRTQELIEAKQKAERDAWDIKNPNGSKTPYVTKTTSILDLSSSDQAQIIAADSIAIQAREKANADLLKSLLEKYQDYTAKRVEIEKKFNKDLASLESQRNATNAGDINRAIAELNKQRTKDLSSVDFEEFQKQIDWSTVFGNLDRLSTDALKSVRDKIRTFLSGIGSDISKEDLKSVSEAFENLNTEIAGRNPLSELIGSYDAFKKSCDDVADAQKKVNDLFASGKGESSEAKKAIKELTDAQKARKDSLVQMNASINSIGQTGSQMVNSGQELTDMLTNIGIKMPDSIKGALSGVGQIMGGLEKFDLTNPASIISSSISVLSGIGNTMASIFGGGGSVISQDVFDRYDTLMSVMDKVITKQKELLDSMAGQDAVNASKEAAAAIEKQINATKKMGADWLNSGSGRFKKSYGKRAYERLKEYRDQITALGIDFDALGGRITGIFDLSVEQLLLLQTELPEAWNALGNETSGYLQTIIDSKDELEKLKDQLKEILTGITFDSAKDSLKELLKNADTTMSDIADNFEDYMRDAIMNILVDNIMSEKLKAWYDRFAKSMEDNVLTESEKLSLQNEYKAIYEEAVKQRDELLGLANLNLNNTSQKASSGGFQSMSQETGDRLDGRFAALQMSGLRIEGFLTTISACNNNILNMSVQSNNELRKHTELFKEMKTIHLNSFYQIEGTKDFLRSINEMMGKIDKNTSRL